MPSFDDIKSQLDKAAQDVADRTAKESAETDAVGNLQTVTAQANQSIQDATAKREQARADTTQARATVEGDRAALHALVDQVLSEPADAPASS